MMDELEEQRPLHISEWNFRNIIKNKLIHVLMCKQDLWKNRCTVRWANLGDENTSFFHSMATVHYRHNNIARFTLPDGTEVTEHSEKATVLWSSFKQRLG
jgi:hypothetical protein